MNSVLSCLMSVDFVRKPMTASHLLRSARIVAPFLDFNLTVGQVTLWGVRSKVKAQRAGWTSFCFLLTIAMQQLSLNFKA